MVDSCGARRDAVRVHSKITLVPLAALALAAAFTSCAHTRMSCVERAEEQYRRCLNPYVVINQGTEPNPVKGEDAQACRENYEHALSRCEPAPETPMPAIPGTSTSTTPRP